MSRVEPLALRVEDRNVLQERVRASTVSAGAAQRARMLLLPLTSRPTRRSAASSGEPADRAVVAGSLHTLNGLAGLGHLPRSQQRQPGHRRPPRQPHWISQSRERLPQRPRRHRQGPPAPRRRPRRRRRRLRVRYLTAATLVETLYRGQADNSVGRVINTLLRHDLVVLDELGFARWTPPAANCCSGSSPPPTRPPASAPPATAPSKTGASSCPTSPPPSASSTGSCNTSPPLVTNGDSYRMRSPQPEREPPHEPLPPRPPALLYAVHPG